MLIEDEPMLDDATGSAVPVLEDAGGVVGWLTHHRVLGAIRGGPPPPVRRPTPAPAPQP